MGHCGSISQLAHQSTRSTPSATFDSIIVSKTVAHLTRYLLFVICTEQTGNGSIAVTITKKPTASVYKSDVLDSQVVDTARHLSEDACGTVFVGNLAIVDDFATTVIVSLENIGMTNGNPL